VKSENSLDTGDSASNVSGLFLLTSVVQNVCVCTMDFVSAGTNALEELVAPLSGIVE